MSGYPTNDTFDSLVDEVITSLGGFGADTDQVTTLTGPIGPTDTVIPYDNDITVGRGVIEIDQELIYVTGTSGSNLTCAPWGRGWKGTSAATHSANVAIFASPIYPRSIVAREVNNVIRQVYPNLFAVGTTDITMNSRDWQYELPVGCERVLSVDWKYSVLTQWQPMHGWEMVNSANSTDFPTSGKFLAVNEGLPADAILHVTYAKPPSLLVGGSDAFAATTGLPGSSRDVIIYGAASRLLPWMDGSHIIQESVPSDAQDQVRPPGTAIQVGRELRSIYAMRLQQESQQLLHQYPLRSHKVR